MDLREQGRPASARGLAIGAVTLLVAFQGCFAPDLSDAECLPCPDNVCPSGLACQQGRCVKPNSTATCPVDSSAAMAGRAGMTSTATGGRDGQGGTSAGLAGAESGSGGDAGAPSDELELKISIPDAICTARPVSAVATAEQGTGPYRFSVVQGTATLSP